jgi:putative endonuclease
MFYMYVIKSEEDYYVGSTNDLKRRMSEHNSNKGGLTTQGRLWELVYYEAYKTEKAVRVREKELKHNRRVKQFLLDRIKRYELM